jgi:hypothetical protein
MRYIAFLLKKVRAAFQKPSEDSQWSKQLYKRNDSHYLDAKADGNRYNLKR